MPNACEPKLPFGLDEREMSCRTYLTHRLAYVNRLKSCRCMAAQPAQQENCDSVG